MKKLISLLAIWMAFLVNETCSQEIIMPDHFANQGSLPSCMVYGVNVISGDYHEYMEDLVVPGIGKHYINRSYVSSEVFQGNVCTSWNNNYIGIGSLVKVKPTKEANYTTFNLSYKGPNGSYNSFSKGFHKKNVTPEVFLKLKEDSFDKGLTNTGSGRLSGSTNSKNDLFIYRVQDKNLRLVKGNGDISQFYMDPKSYRFQLRETKKLNGHLLKYEFDKNGLPSKVSLTNSCMEPISTIKMHYQMGKNAHIQINGDGNASVKYHLGGRYKVYGVLEEYFINKVESNRFPSVMYLHETYGHRTYGTCARIETKIMELGNKLKINYFKERIVDKSRSDYKEQKKIGLKRGDPKIHKVKYLSATIGHDSQLYAFAFFDYFQEKPGCGYTSVNDARTKTTTFYSYTNYRINKIIKNRLISPGKYENYIIETFDWYTDQVNKGNLKCKKLLDGQNRLIEQNEYFYDNRGNVLENHYRGNLTGKSSFIDPTETYIKKYTYHGCAGNLLATEEDGKKRIVYHYYENTNLLKMKYVFAEGRIQSRTFYEYDKNSAPILEINDDGSSEDINDYTNVTERHFTQITNRTEFPIGLPQIVYKKCYDVKNGHDRILSKKILSYTSEGWLEKEEVYDEANNLIARNSFGYDGQGRCISETDILGRTTHKVYNAANLIHSIQTPRSDYYTAFLYDCSYRLIAEERIQTDGQRFNKTYHYDYSGNKISELDIYGNVTFFKYDHQNRLIETITPSGQTSKIEYNCKNQPISKIDHDGNITRFEYTSRDDPSCITYPDGRQERFFYDLDGTLLESIAKDGTITENQVDYQGRTVKKVVKSAEGNVLHETKFKYNAFHLLEETDAAGVVTTYEYDFAGRLVRIKKLDQLKDTKYDLSGRIAETKTYSLSDNEGFLNRYEYDLLNQVVYEAVCDLDGNVQTEQFFSYDVDGNVIEIRTSGHGGVNITKKEYDHFGNTISSTDGEGYTTLWKFDYNFISERGQKVGYEEMIDPMGRVTVTIKNLNGQVDEIILKDSCGQEIHKKKLFYGSLGQLKEQVDYIFEKDKVIRTLKKQWFYNNIGEIVCVKDAVDTPFQKEKHLTYNARGQKSSVKKSDGVYINYTYDPKGLLKELSSSDSTIHYRYDYDIVNNLIKSEDVLTGRSTDYQYNFYNQMISEKLSNHLVMRYAYDGIGRNNRIILPDESSISKSYKGNFLTDVSRFDKKGHLKYNQFYLDYDKQGQYKTVILPGKNGRIDFEFDVLGRIRSCKSNHWQEKIEDIDPVGNIISKQILDHSEAIQENFEYDALNQLISEKDHCYTYDSLHNRTSKNGQDNHINDLNQVTFDGKNTYNYDLSGNLIDIEDENDKVIFSYDALDRLKSVEKQNIRYCYEYDATNRRVTKKIESKNEKNEWKQDLLERYLYQGQCEIGVVNEKDEVIQLRVLGIGKGAEIGASIAFEIKNKDYIPIHDNQGNVAILLDLKKGEICEKYHYSSFGEETIYNASGKRLDESIQPWHYCSKRMDPETGFVYFGYRYYSTNLGRWITADPLGDKDGPNLYAYVKNSPLSMFDSYGLMGEYDDEIYYHHETWRAGFAGVGKLIEGACFHALPPCEERAVGEWVGRYMQGQGPVDNYSWDRGSVLVPVGDPSLNQGRPAYCITGILSEVENTRDMALSMSEKLNGAEVIGICHLSKGAFTDLVDVAIGNFGKEIDFIHDTLQDKYNQLKMSMDNPAIDIAIHSRGTIEINLASSRFSPELKSSLHVVGYGGELIQKNGYGSAKCYMNRGDPLCFYNLFKGHDCTQMNFTDEPFKFNLINNHYISNPGYQRVMKLQCDNILETREK